MAALFVMSQAARTNEGPPDGPSCLPKATQKEGSTARRFFEALAVIATGVLHLVFVELLHASAAIIAMALLGWGAYIAWRVRSGTSVLQSWGFRGDNFWRSLLASSLVATTAVAAMTSIAIARGTIRLHWHMLPLFLLYPLWGIVQQFLVQALVVGNLSQVPGKISSRWVVTLVAAALFGMVHLPNLRLAAATFVLGLTFTPIFLKWRNLWPLGLYHGWLGVLFYFWVLERDPWLEVLGH